MGNNKVSAGVPGCGMRISSAVLLLVAMVGCTAKPEAYYEVFREQRAAYREVTAILADIQDEKSMADAKAKLLAQYERLDAVASKFAALPHPPPPEVIERFRDESPSMQRAINDMKEQVGRVQKLKGGEAFFKQFESKSSGVFNAVQP